MAVAPEQRCNAGSLEEEATLGGPKFDPPLYIQRYDAVLKVAREMQARKVIDMGCAGCKLLRRLKREQYIEELVGVDVDSEQLFVHQNIVNPLTTDFLMPRQLPLLMKLMKGSIAEPDDRLKNFDLIACVEVIEHLDPPVLEGVPGSLFGVLQPRVVVITTPNSEFNVLFPGFSGFRHHDHRFEWTRVQFQAWCSSVCERFPYWVEFGGVGFPPPGSGHGLDDVGYCSQMAVFTRVDGGNPLTVSDADRINCKTPYEIIAKCAHPYEENPLTANQKLCQEAEYYLHTLFQQKLQEAEYDDTGSVSDFRCCESTDSSVFGASPSSGDMDATKVVQKGLNILGHDEACAMCLRTADEEETENGSSCTVQICLVDLLRFPKIRSLCSSVEEISSALLPSELIRLDTTRMHALFEVQDSRTWSDLEEDSDNSELEQVSTDDNNLDQHIIGGPISVMPEECWD